MSLRRYHGLDGGACGCDHDFVPDPAQYAPGQQLPGTVYRVVRHLATGGMGSVYDVEDVTVGKRYVLKTLHPNLVSRHDLAKRMEAEARTLAKLQHPNIVDVVTAGVTTDQQRMPFYVMERLNGQNLRVVLEKKGSLELSHCYRIAIDVLDALEQAHENAVIHRDVKPENIFLHRNPNGTTITKLLDFGIMRLLDRKASHTQGKFIGTLRYASPEQIMGGDLGPPTDLYSLGIVLYEMIAGRGPFDEIGDAMAIGVAHAQRPPPPLSTFVANVPPEAERLVMSSLAKMPYERPRDAFTFASELRRLLRDEEAAPKSATAVNVLTSAPQTRAADPISQGPQSPGEGMGPTDRAPPPTPVMASGPSTLVEDGNPADKHVPATVRQAPPGASSGNTAIAMAATVESDPMHMLQAARADRAARGGGGSGVSAPLEVDRSAATRTSGVSGFTQRLAQHGTSMEDLAAAGAAGVSFPPLASEEAVSAALAQPAPLEVPPTSGQPPQSDNMVFASQRFNTTGTGPLSGEAKTRPPERGLALGLGAAAVVAVLLVGGAVLAVKKPWASIASGSSATTAAATVTAPVTATASAPATAAATVAATATAPATAAATASATAAATATGAGAGVPTPPTTPHAAAPSRTVKGGPAAPPKETASAAPAKKPPRPPGAAVRPEDVGFE